MPRVICPELHDPQTQDYVGPRTCRSVSIRGDLWTSRAGRVIKPDPTCQVCAGAGIGQTAGRARLLLTLVRAATAESDHRPSIRSGAISSSTTR